MKTYWFLIVALGLFHNGLVMADDTEIYVRQNTDSAPNVIFLMDTSGSMGWTEQDGVGAPNIESSRMGMVRQAAADVITNTDGINIALGRFNYQQGGRLLTPMLPIGNRGVKTMVTDILYKLPTSGSTPLTEAIDEMSAYLRGANRVFGYTTTDYPEYCMAWAEPSDDDGDSGKTELLDATSWWYTLIENGHSGVFEDYYLEDNNSSWKDYSELGKTKLEWVVIDRVKRTYWIWTWWENIYGWQEVPDNNAYELLNRYQIGEESYGQGNPPWFMTVLPSSYWQALFDTSADTYKSWKNLDSWVKEVLKDKGIRKQQYNSYTTKIVPIDYDDSDETEGLECLEYLNLDDVYDENNNYISPIQDECQSNHIVVFTDGAPQNDTDSNTRIRNLLKELPSGDYPTSNSNFSTSCSGDGGCAEEQAYALYNSDASPAYDGNQAIHIHTVSGFVGTQSVTQRLSDMATYGGGINASGNDVSALRLALTKVFENITQTSGTFAAPAVTVNAFNNLEHLDQLYYSVFSPETTASWGGNIKRYRLDIDGVIRDVNGNEAIDSSSGFFADNAQSFWTLSEDAPDGTVVNKGGAARRLTDPDDRNIYTNIYGSDLTASGNRITPTNTALLTLNAFSALSSTDQTKTLYWLAGYDTTSSGYAQPRRTMEDPLHSRPLLLSYKSATSGSADTTMYVGTNSGYLHAFDTNAANPVERFAFLPKDLMSSAIAYAQNDTDKVYGLDGRISHYHIDENNNSLIDSGEKALLYVGMRRGGRNYYALNVADRDKPKLAWQISGGDTGFEELGQTWSEMTPIRVLWNGVEKDVLVFGGGYDEAEDGYKQRTDHTVGNAVYMVDPLTGDLLWKASKSGANLNLSSMTSSIVGDISPVDYNGDGLTDVLYTADLGGRIWRFDLAQTESASSSAGTFATGGAIADFGSDNTEISNVRFFSTIDVSYINRGTFIKDGEVYSEGRYQLVIGSGNRSNPLNTTTVDNIYIVNDFDTRSAPDNATYTTLSKSDLADLSAPGSYTLAQQKSGGYYKLPGSGEKILSDAITKDGYSYLTSYKPVSTSRRSGCEPDIGESVVYRFKLDYQKGELTTDSSTLSTGLPGIVDTPVVIRQEAICEYEVDATTGEAVIDSLTGERIETCVDVDYYEPSADPSDEEDNDDTDNTDTSPTMSPPYYKTVETLTFGLETIQVTDDGSNISKSFWRELQ